MYYRRQCSLLLTGLTCPFFVDSTEVDQDFAVTSRSCCYHCCYNEGEMQEIISSSYLTNDSSVIG